MSNIKTSFRNTCLAGLFAIVPVAVTIFIVYKIEMATRTITEAIFHRPIPLVGIFIAAVAVYVAGVLVTSLIGRWCLKQLDRALSRVPGFSTLYQSWKHVSLTPGGTEGTFSRVVLVQSDVGLQLGFTAGVGLPDNEQTWCVFLPAAPNPIAGRLVFIPKSRCILLSCGPEEAFKVLLSTGNYIPPELGQATQKLLTPAG